MAVFRKIRHIPYHIFLRHKHKIFHLKWLFLLTLKAILLFPGPESAEEYMLSKTVEFGRSMNIDDMGAEVQEAGSFWSRWDEKYFIPFFRQVSTVVYTRDLRG